MPLKPFARNVAIEKIKQIRADSSIAARTKDRNRHDALLIHSGAMDKPEPKLKSTSSKRTRSKSSGR